MGPVEDTREAWLPGEATATITAPAPSTSAAPLAVRATPRFFEPPEPRQNRLAVEVPSPVLAVEVPSPVLAVEVSAVEVPSLVGDVCCLRNHLDPDTAPSSPRFIHNWTKN
jgi:hypothetical protein